MRSDASGRPSPGPARWLAALAADRRDGLDSGISRVTSLRLPPVVIAASGMLCAAPRPSGGARCRPCPGPPGTDRWPARPSSRGCGWSRPLRGRSPAGLRPAARTAAARAGAAILRPRSSPAAAASRSPPSRSPAPGAETPADPGVQHETGSRTALATIQTPTTWTPRITRDDRQQPLDPAHNSSSISHGLAAVFLVSTGSHPLRPASTRTDTPSFPEVPKPPFVRSRKRRHAPGPASPLRFSRAPSGRVLRPWGPQTGPTCRAVPRPCRLTRASWHPLCGGPTGQDPVRDLPAHPGRHRSRDLRRPGRVPSP